MWVRLLPVLPLFAAGLSAQTSRVVDEATFTFTKAGANYGTETFRIIQRPGREGTEYAVQATRTIEGRVVRTTLSADSAGNLSSYSKIATGSNPVQLTAQRVVNRLTVNESGPQGLSRDYPLSPGTAILDDDAIHTLYFVSWPNVREVRFIDLSGRASGVTRVDEVSRDNVALGSGTVRAIRYAIGSGDDRREIWVDSERRLVKVAHPSRQVVGIRDLPPR